MKVNTFDEYIKDYTVGHHNTLNYEEALNKFIEKKYDIISFNGSLTLNPGDTILYTRDYISNIRIDVPIYYVVNGIEFPVTDNTRLLPFLTPLNQIILRNKTGMVQNITFKRWFIRKEISDQIIHRPVSDGSHFYCYGEIHNDY